MVSRSAGFTLLELMIAILIASILLLVAVPFTARWAASARQIQTRGDLADAVGTARALAVRNRLSAGWSEPVTRLTLEEGLIQVTEIGATDARWTAPLPPGISLVGADGESAFDCINYNSRGMPVADSVCAGTDTEVLVRIAGMEDLNVHLL